MEFKFSWNKPKTDKPKGAIASRNDELNAIIEDSFRVKAPPPPTPASKKKK